MHLCISVVVRCRELLEDMLPLDTRVGNIAREGDTSSALDSDLNMDLNPPEGVPRMDDPKWRWRGVGR
jgi:hypothetical protein